MNTGIHHLQLAAETGLRSDVNGVVAFRAVQDRKGVLHAAPSPSSSLCSSFSRLPWTPTKKITVNLYEIDPAKACFCVHPSLNSTYEEVGRSAAALATLEAESEATFTGMDHALQEVRKLQQSIDKIDLRWSAEATDAVASLRLRVSLLEDSLQATLHSEQFRQTLLGEVAALVKTTPDPRPAFLAVASPRELTTMAALLLESFPALVTRGDARVIGLPMTLARWFSAHPGLDNTFAGPASESDTPEVLDTALALLEDHSYASFSEALTAARVL